MSPPDEPARAPKPPPVARCASCGIASLQAILDAIPAPIFFKDVQGAYRGCNVAFETFLGRRRNDILGLTVEEVAPPDLAAVYRAADDALLAKGGGGVQVYETEVENGQGERRSVVFHKAVFTHASGEVGGLVGSYLDVTERERAVRALRERAAAAAGELAAAREDESAAELRARVARALAALGG